MRLSQKAAATVVLVAAAGGCATALRGPPSASTGGWETGVVEAGADFPILVRRGGDRAVVALGVVPILGGLEDGRRLEEGDRVRYRVLRIEAGILVSDRLEILSALATDRDRLARVGDLAEDAASGGALLADVRPAEAFAGAHVAGARSLPGGGPWNVERRLGVERTAPLVFYGMDEFDPAPFDAARAAIAEGFTAVRVMEGGLRAWVRAGRTTVVSAGHLVRGGSGGAVILDVRPRAEVDSGSIPGSVSIPVSELRPEPLSGRPYWPTLVLVGRNAADAAVAEALVSIRRWRGLDELEKTQPIQVLEGGFEGWVAAGGVPAAGGALAAPSRLGRFEDPERLEVEEFRAAWRAGGGAGFLLDVRPGMKPGDVPSFAKNIPLGELAGRLAELPRDREIWIYCGSGRRSAVAREILVRAGYRARYLKDYAPTR